MHTCRIHFHAGSPGWQELCRSMALSRDPFAVHAVGKDDFLFCKEICDEFNYFFTKQRYEDEVVAVFQPRSP